MIVSERFNKKTLWKTCLFTDHQEKTFLLLLPIFFQNIGTFGELRYISASKLVCCYRDYSIKQKWVCSMPANAAVQFKNSQHYCWYGGFFGIYLSCQGFQKYKKIGAMCLNSIQKKVSGISKYKDWSVMKWSVLETN